MTKTTSSASRPVRSRPVSVPREIGAFLLDCDEGLGVAQLVQEVRLEFPRANEGEIADGAAVAQSMALKSVKALDDQLRTLSVLPELLDT